MRRSRRRGSADTPRLADAENRRSPEPRPNRTPTNRTSARQTPAPAAAHRSSWHTRLSRCREMRRSARPKAPPTARGPRDGSRHEHVPRQIRQLLIRRRYDDNRPAHCAQQSHDPLEHPLGPKGQRGFGIPIRLLRPPHKMIPPRIMFF